MRRPLSTFLIFFISLGLFPFSASSASESQQSPKTQAADLRPQSASLLKLNDPIGLAKMPEGRMLLKYLARCALDEGTHLETEVDGVSYRFEGGLGLAPEWAKGPLSKTGERWVSACLMAHTNFFGIHVPISIRGPHPSLEKSMNDEERRAHPIEEAAFFGNLFDPKDFGYACKGHQKGATPYLRLRVCAEEDKDRVPFTRCGFIFVESCSEADSSSYQKVCESQDEKDGFYRRCRVGDRIYDEVITVFLKQ